MKQLYTQSSWTDSELASKKMDIYRNVITSMRTLITETIEPSLSKVEPLVYDGEVKDYVDTQNYDRNLPN